MTLQLSDSIQAAIRYIDRRLATIDQAPSTWGSPESLELQTLLLFEIRHFLLRRRTYAKNPYEARRAFFRFVREHINNAGAALMAAQIPPDQVEEELPKLLGLFRNEVALRIEPENPFELNDLVVELIFTREPSGTAPFEYLVTLQDVMTLIYKAETSSSTSLQWSRPEFRWLEDEPNPRSLFVMHGMNDSKGFQVVLEAINAPQSTTVINAVNRLRRLQWELSIKLVRVGGMLVGSGSIVLEPQPGATTRAAPELHSALRKIPPAIRREAAISPVGGRNPLLFPAMRNIESLSP